MSDFSSQINDLIEYKKLVVKLEETLKLKEEEIQKILKMNSDLKDFCDEMKKELNKQSQKIIQQHSELKNISKQYENKINLLNEAHENEKQKYDEKIMELSAYNPHSHEIKIKNDLETKYKIIIKNKDLEISNLNNELNELKENLELKEQELNILKINLNEQLYTERETHSYQMKDLLSKISKEKELEENDKENENFQEFRLNMKYNEEKTEKLHKELDELREEKVQNEIKYNKQIFDLDTKLKEEANKNQILKDEIDTAKENIQKIKTMIIDNSLEINRLNEININLNKEKESLMMNIQEKDDILEQQKKGLNELKHIIKLKSNDYEFIIEENQNLKNQIIELEEKLNKEKKPDKDNNLYSSNEMQKENINLYKNAYEEIREKYRRLLQEHKKMNTEIKNQKQEIKNLNHYLKKLKKSGYDSNNSKNEDILERFREVNQKKIYYKQHCKKVNKYIMKIFNILTNEQKQNLENDGIVLSNVNDYISENSNDNF